MDILIVVGIFLGGALLIYLSVKWASVPFTLSKISDNVEALAQELEEIKGIINSRKVEKEPLK